MLSSVTPTTAKTELPLIYCVDDTPANLTIFYNSLSPFYKVKLLNSGEKALALLQKESPDLILLDVMMSGIDGYEVCRRIRDNPVTHHIPVLFITAKTTAEDEQAALKAGGNDFIAKPINPKVLLARVEAHLQIKAKQDLLRQENQALEAEMQRCLSSIFKLQDASLAVLISMAEFRQNNRDGHIQRIQMYLAALAKEYAKKHPEASLNNEQIELMVQATPLHDIGKALIPDDILLKPNPLTGQEFELVKTHTQKGHEMLDMAAQRLNNMSDLLSKAQEIALSHHEKWDGTGYPVGLSANRIPLSARMMAVVDVYDALTSDRPFKKAWSHADAIQFIQEQSGHHFDPALVDAFIHIEADIAAIQLHLADN